MSFITPLFLIGLAAAALPVLFHFVRKMQAKQVAFSSLMFLQATPKERVKRRRLRDILLMALRMAIFALLAVAFARPFLPQETIPFIPQRENQSVVLLLDNSYSMQAAGLFDQARQAALSRLDAGGPNDEFSLILFSDAAQQATAFSRDRALHRTVIEQAEVSYRPTDFYEPLRRAEDVLADARYDDRVVVLVSDFQQNGWTGSLDNWKLAAGVVFEPVKIAVEAPGNAYVEAFQVSTRRAGPEVAVQYDARIAAQGESAEEETAVRLIVDQAEVDRQAVPARASSRLTFQQIAPREGYFQGELTLADDDLAVDNRYYFTYAVGGRPAILAIDEGPRGYNDAFFLRNAFALGNDALYDFSDGGRGRISGGVLRAHDVVFLSNVSALSNTQVGTLRNYVEAGGTLVLSFGEQVNLAAFAPVVQELGVGQAVRTVTARDLQAADAIIGEVDLRHPVFSVFAGTGRGAILRPTFRRYVQVTPDSAATVLGTYDTGDPFLLERRLGPGKVLVYTSTFSTAWTDFPINELYVPFVYQLVKYGVSSAEARHQYTVGEAVALTGRPGETWDVRTPANDLYRVPIDDTGTGFFRDTDVPGHYTAALGREQFPFSVNVDPRESNLEARDEEEVYAAVVAPPDDVATTPEQAAALEVEHEEKNQKLWRIVLLLVIVLFAAETVLANRRNDDDALRRQ